MQSGIETARWRGKLDHYFVSDLHLGDAEEVIGRVLAFLDERREGDTVWFLGDSLDFSIGHRVLWTQGLKSFWAGVQKTTARGVRCIFLSGNHDPDLDPFIDSSGAERGHAGLIDCDGLKVWIAHGDVEASPSWFKRQICALTHRDLVLQAARAIPLPITLRALKLYQKLRHQRSAFASLPKSVWTLFQREVQSGANAVILGHFHHPFCGRMGEGKVPAHLFVLGDWRCYSNYLRLSKGRFGFFEAQSPGCWKQRAVQRIPHLL